MSTIVSSCSRFILSVWLRVDFSCHLFSWFFDIISLIFIHIYIFIFIYIDRSFTDLYLQIFVTDLILIKHIIYTLHNTVIISVSYEEIISSEENWWLHCVTDVDNLIWAIDISVYATSYHIKTCIQNSAYAALIIITFLGTLDFII